MTTPLQSHSRTSGREAVGFALLAFATAHGAPIVGAILLWWILWWGHVPNVATTEAAMLHVTWIGILTLIYVALQARSVIAQPRTGVTHTLIAILVSLLPAFVIGYALFDWLRGSKELALFQVVVVVQAALAVLIDVVIFTWMSLRLQQLSIQAFATHQS